MPTLKEFSKWLSATKTAEETGYSRQTIHNMGDDGRIRGVKTAVGWLFDPQDVQRIKQETSKA